ncbi:MAG TPA: hypothetical protein VL966_07010 [Alphaproteobacteria bacterium]|jgi:hypothetical protein|nr:hypothetical protein [Alphaproteobacteria bacterium]
MLSSAAQQLLPSDNPRGGGPGSGIPFGLNPTEREDLPYHVELWDETKKSVELILAATASASIGYAAYFAATKEFPSRFVTLRHKHTIISRWNGPSH